MERDSSLLSLERLNIEFLGTTRVRRKRKNLLIGARRADAAF